MLAGGAEVSVKIAAGIAAVLAVICTAGLSARAAGSRAVSVSRNMVVVTTTADVVNGKASSIAALNRKPGRDGISLREALLAADHTGGSATVYILFSHRLNGKTIEIRSELPPIHRNHLVLEGIAPNGAPAMVTLDGRRALMNKLGELLLVQASEVSVRWLRFTGVDPRRNLATQVAAVQVGQGRISQAFTPKWIANVQIVDDVFDNSGFDFPYIGSGGGNTGLLADGLMFEGVNTHISGVMIARNTFRHFNPDAVGVQEDSSGDTGNGVVIENNTFAGNEIPIELGIADLASRLTGTQIIGNTITPNSTTTTVTGTGGSGISIDSNARNGTIDQTLIEDNAISGPATLLLIQAAATVPPVSGAGDVISNTQIINDVLNPTAVGAGGIGLIGGDSTTSPPSSISGVTIENDTIVNNQGNAGLFHSVPNRPGASGNQITDVTVRNTILYEPFGIPIFVSAGSMGGGVNLAPDVLTNSLISGPGWAGTNGNINSDPLFVNAPAGDYHLTAGSPAINAGTPIGAPSYDLDGAPRDTPPDIGAFEFGATPRPLLTVTSEQLGGSGTITSNPAGISCGTTCSARFDPNTTVTLTAKPDRGSKFLGWSRPCSRKARCTVRLKSAQSITARFAP
jgi:List-Bact-rpt repeat protein